MLVAPVPEALNIAAFIDHTILRADATRDDVAGACSEARQYGFATVCVNAFWVKFVAEQLADSAVKVCSTVGFPLGATTTEIKMAEAETAVRDGALEIDMVQNIGALRSGDLQAVEADIRAIADAAHSGGALLKVILETALLNDSEKETSCRLALAANADFVKTSTGFGPSGATVADVKLMRRIVGNNMGVKASGGIRTLADAQQMIAAGANRIGASASVQIVSAALSTSSPLSY